MSDHLEGFVRVASLADLETRRVIVVPGDDHPIAVFHAGGEPRAVDNRCPHLGFPLHKGTVKDGLLVCHWHHARFDLGCGGTLDPWADDVRPHAVRLLDGQVWVELKPAARNPVDHALERLADGLDRDIRLVVAKSVIALDQAGAGFAPALRVAAGFGARRRAAGWGSGMSILTMAANLEPHLGAEDRPRAHYLGQLAVAADCAGQPPRHAAAPLPSRDPSPARLKRWLRELVEVRDGEGAERVLATAVAARLPRPLLADMLYTAATDRVYLDGGHALDFVNKAMELLDHLAGSDEAEAIAGDVVVSLAAPLVRAERMEESGSWRSPVDLIALAGAAHHGLADLLGRGAQGERRWTGPDRDHLVPVLLADDPAAALAGLAEALARGATPAEVAETVAYAAALRIARFPISNEYGDWDTALHTFTYANAALAAVLRVPTAEVMRGVLDAALSVYQDRFLNLPPAILPSLDAAADGARAEVALAELGTLTDVQQQVDRAGTLAAAFLAGGGDPAELRAVLGSLLVREDAHFHTIQAVEAGYHLAGRLGARGPMAGLVLVAVARYVAAHAPTARVRGQTWRTALRLARGEALFEEA